MNFSFPDLPKTFHFYFRSKFWCQIWISIWSQGLNGPRLANKIPFAVCCKFPHWSLGLPKTVLKFWCRHDCADRRNLAHSAMVEFLKCCEASPPKPVIQKYSTSLYYISLYLGWEILNEFELPNSNNILNNVEITKITTNPIELIVG